MRSLLLVRSPDEDLWAAAFASGADAVVLDCGASDAGRLSLPAAVAAIPPGAVDRPGRPHLVVKLPALRSGLVDRDLDVAMAARPDAVLLPGSVGAVGLQQLAAKLAVHEAERDLPAGRTGIMAAAADTAEGVLALGSIPGATPRLRALVWDGAALTMAIGKGAGRPGEPSRRPNLPVVTARGLLVLAAAAAGVPALDGATLGDRAAVARTCLRARRDGFDGKLAVAADQIDAIARCFSDCNR